MNEHMTMTSRIDLTKTGHILPREQGQCVYDVWHACGGLGALCVTVDRSDGAAMAERASYRIYQWGAGEYEPWNGSTGTRGRGRKITREQAECMLARACDEAQSA